MNKIKFIRYGKDDEFSFICSRRKANQMKTDRAAGYIFFYSYHEDYVGYYPIAYTSFAVNVYCLQLRSKSSDGKIIKVTISKRDLFERGIEYRHSYRKTSYEKRRREEELVENALN